VDLTPRRLQAFRTPKGAAFAYTVADPKTQKVMGKGTATPRPKDEVEAERRRLRDEAKKAGKNPDHVKVDPYDGDPTGAYNAHLWWETDTIVDEAGRWEMTVILKDSAPKNTCRVDLTPRRLQAFRTPKGKRFCPASSICTITARSAATSWTATPPAWTG